MTSKSKVKGNGFEHEIVKLAESLGIPAKRARGSDGRSLGEHEEVDCIIGPYKVQAKRRKALTKYMIPNENVDAVVCREDRSYPLIVMPYKDFLQMIAIVKKVLEAKNERKRTKPDRDKQ